MTPFRPKLDRIIEPCHDRFDPRDQSRESLGYVCEHCGGDVRHTLPITFTERTP